MSRLVRLALAALLLMAGLLAVPARADAAGDVYSCTDSGNVWVVVNFKGSISQGCASAPSSGLAALRQVWSVQVQSNGMVAQIGGKPTAPDPDPYIYWNYLHKDKAGDGWGAWVYSTLGAGAYKPKAGSIEGWTYGATGTPMGWSPPSRPAPTTAPVPTKPAAAPPSATTSRVTTAVTAATSQAVRTTIARPGTSEAAAPSSAPVAEPSQSESPSAATAATPTEPAAHVSSPPSAAAESLAPAEEAVEAKGGPAATIGTLAAVAAAGAAGSGWWLLRRRRTTS